MKKKFFKRLKNKKINGETYMVWSFPARINPKVILPRKIKKGEKLFGK